MAVAALLGIDQALDRGRGRAQDHRRLPEMAAHHRHVARLIGHALLLLVALVVLLIDDDQAEIGEGKEQRRAGADHELRLVLGDGAPDAAAQRRRHAGVPFGGAGAETLLAAGDELAGERDLGHQHEHLTPPRQRGCDRLEIDFGLAGAGDAVEQRHGEAAARIGEERACGIFLLCRKLCALQRQIERQRMPVGQRLGDERAGIDQPVDHSGAHAGSLGKARLDPDEAVLRRFDHARPGRGHALRRRSYQPARHSGARAGRRRGPRSSSCAAPCPVMTACSSQPNRRSRARREAEAAHRRSLRRWRGASCGRSRAEPPRADAATPRRDTPQCRAVRPRTGRARPLFLSAAGSRKAQAARAAAGQEPSAARRTA